MSLCRHAKRSSTDGPPDVEDPRRIPQISKHRFWSSKFHDSFGNPEGVSKVLGDPITDEDWTNLEQI